MSDLGLCLVLWPRVQAFLGKTLTCEISRIAFPSTPNKVIVFLVSTFPHHGLHILMNEGELIRPGKSICVLRVRQNYVSRKLSLVVSFKIILPSELSCLQP